MADDLAALLGKRFIERRDVKAIQRADGTYAPVQRYDGDSNVIDGSREPFTMSDLRDHLAGTKTFGHYLVSEENNCRVLCFDIDLAKQGVIGGRWAPEGTPRSDGAPLREMWLSEVPSHEGHKRQLTTELRCMASEIAQRTHDLLEVPVAVSYSGSKGLHVYGLVGSAPAGDVRAAAVTVLDSFSGPMKFEQFRGVNFFRLQRDDDHNIEIEVFPKQDNLDGKDLGNLLRLPLGVNKKTGHRSFFIDMAAPVDTIVEADALETMSNGTSL